ncbi:MAG: DUF6090 family protein [Lysobacterales bacterium]
MRENKLNKYLLYATGEILLVVIGILIALQINNQNDERKERIREIHYLENIKTDLDINLLEMDRYLDIRTESIAAANRIIEHFEGKPITDVSAFNADGVQIYSWQKFWQNNNTFQELVNSGNLALISSDAIKKKLLDIESLYKKMKSEEDHFRFDTEKLIYEPLYGLMDLYPLVNNFEYRVSNGESGKDMALSSEYFSEYLKSTKLKNGFVMTVLEFGTMNGQMRDMKRMTEELIVLINEDIAK